ncbi:MAG: nucleotidyltransferase family protein [Flavobacteriales bacterium]|nr:nucleotidyltransferase family protein [Flavobacteriales bacterium]
MDLQEKIHHLIIDYNASLLDALTLMDKNNCKLLIVFEDKHFKSLISIGDIQRSLLKNNDFNKPLNQFLRKNINVGNTNQPKEEILELMLNFSAELMPILDEDKNLVDVYFWKDVFKKKFSGQKIEGNIPVVIMAGGKGERLKPITNLIPKPLVPVGKKAFVEIIMDTFKAHGINNFHMSVNHKAELIKQYFEDKPEYSISYYNEDKPLGTAGSLHLMKESINSTFFISNCDILIDQDYSEILRYHQENGNDLTAVAAVKTYSIPYGTMEVEKDGLLKELKEKPTTTYYVNAGLYILEPHLLAEIPTDEFYHITHLMEKIKDRGGKVGVFPVSEGSWMDIGEINQYESTKERFSSRF